MRALTPSEMVFLYKFTKSAMFVVGIALVGYGIWWLVDPIVFHLNSPLWLIGIFPVYVGAMLVLIALAMKEDWFTNARKYW